MKKYISRRPDNDLLIFSYPSSHTTTTQGEHIVISIHRSIKNRRIELFICPSFFSFSFIVDFMNFLMLLSFTISLELSLDLDIEINIL
jgi:hypothetical protein